MGAKKWGGGVVAVKYSQEGSLFCFDMGEIFERNDPVESRELIMLESRKWNLTA